MTENYKNIYLKRGKQESLLRFHPWIFSGAIHHADTDIQEGDVVRVITADGDFVAVGHYQVGTISVRVLSFRDIAIDHAFWVSRLQAALDMRRGIGLADNQRGDTYRVDCHVGSGDSVELRVRDFFRLGACRDVGGFHVGREYPGDYFRAPLE